MTKEELLELLDIEHGSEFTYYENIAELLEADREIGPEPIAEILMEADLATFAEIAESYFYDIMERMPGNDVDIYNIFEAVKRNLVSIAEAAHRAKGNGTAPNSDDGSGFDSDDGSGFDPADGSVADYADGSGFNSDDVGEDDYGNGSGDGYGVASGNIDEREAEDLVVKLAEQLDDFHRYYSLTENCEVMDRASGTTEIRTLRDAISENRLAIMDNLELDFDLEGAKDFAVEEYIVGLGDLYNEE